MKGLDEFLTVFGNITVLEVVEFLIAVGFIIAAYKTYKKRMIEKHEVEKAKDKKLDEALDGVRKYPEYRQQSIDIQKMLTDEIQGLKLRMDNIELNINNVKERMEEIESDNREREQHKLRDKLLSHYKYYTNPDTNPDLSWTEMEANAFWSLADEYEKAGGNGDMHDRVFPAMRMLKVIKH